MNIHHQQPPPISQSKPTSDKSFGFSREGEQTNASCSEEESRALADGGRGRGLPVPGGTFVEGLWQDDLLVGLGSGRVVHADLGEVAGRRSLLPQLVEDALVENFLRFLTALKVHVPARFVDALPVGREFLGTVNLDLLKEVEAAPSDLFALVDALARVFLLRITQHELLALMIAVFAEVV